MKKEISFLKTQWFNLLIGTLWMTGAFIAFYELAVIDPATTATVEIVKLAFLSCFDFMLAFILVFTAVINYNALRVEQLQKRIEILETCAITAIVEESPKHYVVKRRLGPDKED